MAVGRENEPIDRKRPEVRCLERNLSQHERRSPQHERHAEAGDQPIAGQIKLGQGWLLATSGNDQGIEASEEYRIGTLRSFIETRPKPGAGTNIGHVDDGYGSASVATDCDSDELVLEGLCVHLGERKCETLGANQELEQHAEFHLGLGR